MRSKGMVNSTELRVAQVDGAKLRTAEVDALESGPLEIAIKEVRHTHDANGRRRQRPCGEQRLIGAILLRDR